MERHTLTVEELKKKIAHLENTIQLMKDENFDCEFEEKLLKEWRKWLPGGRHHHKLLDETR